MADCAGSPLAKKLGITEGTRLALIGAPVRVDLELPPGARVVTRPRGGVDVILAFFTGADRIEARIDRVVRKIALTRGLVDDKVFAIDATWSALRLVWRLQHRT